MNSNGSEFDSAWVGSVPGGRDWGRVTVWLAGLLVAAGAIAATAHGLFEVARAASVPSGIGWLYPVITDGLALVAYVATTRLSGHGRSYAWSVVVLAALLSGVAQASFLAGGVATASTPLRFGVGAWPAIAAALAAHLLYLLGAAAIHHNRTEDTTRWERSDHPEPGVLCPPVAGRGEVSPAAASRSAIPRRFAPPARAAGCVQAEYLDHPEPDDADGPDHPKSDDSGGPDAPGVGDDPEPGGGPPPNHLPELLPGDRAAVFAELHRRRSGALPSVRELAALAEVGQGTATRALRELREHPPTLRLVGEDPMSAVPDLDQEENS